MNILKKHNVISFIIVNWLVVAICLFIGDVFFRGEFFPSELFKQTFIYLPGYLLMVFPFLFIEFINSKRKNNKMVRFFMLCLILLISLFIVIDTIFFNNISPGSIFKESFCLDTLPATIKIKKCFQERYMGEGRIVFYIYLKKNEINKLLQMIGITSNNQCEINNLSRQKSVKEWLNSPNILYYSTSILQGAEMRFIDVALNKKGTKCVIEIYYF